jgi:hypothetical protein
MLLSRLDVPNEVPSVASDLEDRRIGRNVPLKVPADLAPDGRLAVFLPIAETARVYAVEISCHA